MKRIIVCCDGTGQNGTVMVDPRHYTNVLRLARIINRQDDRENPPIPQLVFYQQGIGSENNFYTEYLKEWLDEGDHGHLAKGSDTARKFWKGLVSGIEGMTGAPLADKVQEAYAFIASNYEPGDKIYLFGFSRGAYTARMVAAFIGEIGIFTREGMDWFGKTFVQYQIIGHTSVEDAAKRTKQLKIDLQSKGLLVQNTKDKGQFSIECVGVFDTVGSVGLPVEMIGGVVQKNIFGFSDVLLGNHIHTAYQALALDEKRKDFLPVLWEQSPEGRASGQKLLQCWFRGVHTDVGGGYRNHDLADVVLVWMLANVQDKLSLNIKYLEKIPEPANKWGTMTPHDSLKGPYRIADQVKDRLGLLEPRTPPRDVFHKDKATNEVIHVSVKEQDIPVYMEGILNDHPNVYAELLPLEEHMRAFINGHEHVDPVKEETDFVDTVTSSIQTIIRKADPGPVTGQDSLLSKVVNFFSPK